LFDVAVDQTLLLVEPEQRPPGDYNADGTVDAADYVTWRKTGGSLDDYNTWRANFGQTFFTGGRASSIGSSDPLSPAVPEPTAMVLLLIAANSWCLQGCRPRRKH
jgi:hypothetical protein